MNRALIEQLIAKHEGRRSKVYLDDEGIPTIGIGWNLRDEESADICEHFGLTLTNLVNGTEILTDSQIDQVFDYQLTEVISQANFLLPNFPTMPDAVQSVVCDLLFNMGITRFSKFVSTIGQLKAGKWKAAAADLENSLWFHQVKSRATEDVALLNAA